MADDPDGILPEERIPEPRWPKERLAERRHYKDLEARRHAEKTACKLFAMLPNVEALSVFSEQCPYATSQVDLCDFWETLLEQHSVVE